MIENTRGGHGQRSVQAPRALAVQLTSPSLIRHAAPTGQRLAPVHTRVLIRGLAGCAACPRSIRRALTQRQRARPRTLRLTRAHAAHAHSRAARARRRSRAARAPLSRAARARTPQPRRAPTRQGTSIAACTHAPEHARTCELTKSPHRAPHATRTARESQISRLRDRPMRPVAPRSRPPRCPHELRGS